MDEYFNSFEYGLIYHIGDEDGYDHGDGELGNGCGGGNGFGCAFGWSYNLEDFIRESNNG
jgi:hypothetical protein